MHLILIYSQRACLPTCMHAQRGVPVSRIILDYWFQGKKQKGERILFFLACMLRAYHIFLMNDYCNNNNGGIWGGEKSSLFYNFADM